MSMPSKMYGKTNKSPRAAGDLDRQLKRQLNFLDSSARLFDEGDHEEAIRLATVIRILLHDGVGTSLLSLMLIRESISFVNTGVYRDILDSAIEALVFSINPDHTRVSREAGDAGLVHLGLNKDGTAGWVAPLTTNLFMPGSPPDLAKPATQNFADWWRKPLIEDGQFNLFSREQLVLVMANQDGGAHVDPMIDEHYAKLTEDFLGVHIQLGPPPNDILVHLDNPVTNNIAFASVRQIAFELAMTLNGHIGRQGYSAEPPALLGMPNLVVSS